ncbi:MAG: DUF1343 domain-containing protein [Pirellulales bacterium]
MKDEFAASVSRTTTTSPLLARLVDDPQSKDRVVLGLEHCLEQPPDVLCGARRMGLVLNQASIDARGRYACDLLAQRFPGRLVRLFSPQHGLWGEQQANMIESPHGFYPPLELPVWSLYGETRRPNAEMLEGLDVLIVDLQDVGTRVYTFAWTLLECLIACAEHQVPLVVLDRPNPLGGRVVEGPRVLDGFRSFVGNAAIPLRHGLTLGEFAGWLNTRHQINASLTVVPARGWRRDDLWSDLHRAWTPPSPNMPRFETAVVYPGQVLLEGTNLSEGRGTTTPFEVCGAPFVDPFELARALSDSATIASSNITVRPIRFVPTFDKWRGESCGGVALQAADARKVRSVSFTVELLRIVRQLYGNEFRWLPPPYEYEYLKPPIDILWGSPDLRTWVDAATKSPLPEEDSAAWWTETNSALLYS